ncbi:hypothetical protein BSF41_43870 [Flavobacterium sp. ACN2]|jgi:hypothetical protein|uniref:imm11 family protein n=1 Tax=Flavobacterium sp. ACN2 TaxID=1975676 RepID=UPI000BB3587D|nr:DUF1629 domain-containing protein [Flavobacterium sp. ACN2]PBI83954.1 hypothetical protein BSF41_43870 [Flavobacterium sp. ACN2]
MKKYLDFTTSNDIDIIGYYPQVSNTENNLFGSPFAPKRINYGEIPEEIPHLELQFNKNTKVTDLLSTYNPYFGFLVSERLEKIISSFHLPPHKFYPIKIIRGDHMLNYFWFNFFDNLFDFIDLKKSTIEIYHKFNFNVLDTLSIDSEENLKKINSNLDFEKSIRLKELFFNANFPNYDIITNNIMGSGNFISEALRDSLNENNITGFLAIPTDVIVR